MIKYLKNLFTSILLWLKPPKIGHINIDVQELPLHQDVNDLKDYLEVDLNEWKDTIDSVFNSDDFDAEGIKRPEYKPDDKILKHQIQLFWRDYRKLNQQIDDLDKENSNKRKYYDVEDI